MKVSMHSANNDVTNRPGQPEVMPLKAQAASSFYLHWPFCPYRCHFCPFVALAGHEEYMTDYHEALITEVEQYLNEHDVKKLKTIFFGGGTPSTYPPDLLMLLIEILKERCGFEDGYEMTIEVNPGTVDAQKLSAWHKAGINRLSIGVQSLNDEVLKKLNRHQRATDVVWLINAASSIFDNLSIDVIVGLPGISSQEWKQMIHTIVTWPISHVSMYFLTVHQDTQLYFGIQKKQVTLPTDDEVVDLYYWTIEQFARAGFVQYEISNFSRKEQRSLHNSAYWKRVPYKGFGLGACSFDGEIRTQNIKNLLNYLKEIRNTGKGILFSEQLTEEQAWLERLMLGLRQRSGIVVAEILEPLSPQKKEEFSRKAQELLNARLVSSSDGKMMLTPLGLSVANEVIVRLCV